MPILTWLLANPKLVAVGVLLAIFAGLGTAVWVQSARLSSAQSNLAAAEESRDTAIRQHDQLVDDLAKQRKVLDEREALRRQQEEQNAKLRQTIRDALSGARQWADTPVPDGVLRALQAPAPGPAPTKPVGTKPSGKVRRKNQRGLAVLGAEEQRAA